MAVSADKNGAQCLFFNENGTCHASNADRGCGTMATACGTAPREDRRYHNQDETGNGETCGEGDAEQSVDEEKH